jgi:protein-tyrosine phosphatase
MLPRRQITPQTNIYAHLSEITLILPNLYLSSLSAIRSSNLVELGVTHIVTILDFDVQFENWSGNRLVIKLLDGTQANLLDRLDECVEFVQNARSEGGKVVVHCMMGLSRSVCVVAACLIAELGVSVDKALNQIKEKRGCVGVLF